MLTSYAEFTQDGMSATSIPKVTRVLAALLALATALAHIPGFGKSLIDNFALIPSATLGQSKLWNVVTGGFIDINPVEGILNVLLVLTMGKWIETSWGGRSFLVFIMIVNFLSASSTYAMMVGAYVATRKGSFM